MKYTTKTVIGTISTLMIVGMITSFVASSETYFFGQKKSEARVTLRAVKKSVSPTYAQASLLTSDRASTAVVRTAKKPRVAAAPRSCTDQNLYTYTGADNGSLLYGMCIPCPMNKFNTQEKSCSQN